MDATKTVTTSCLPFEPEMILIPAGEFLMGSDDPNKDINAGSDEQPQHSVYLPDYYLAKTPVTNAQYLVFVRAQKYRPPEHWRRNFGQVFPYEENHPVVNVTWQDVLAYCRWLSGVTGKPYSLPSEAEWEKGARGTDGRIYPWGDLWDARRCNTNEGSQEDTTPVGAYLSGASPYGLLDMAGNVDEWTRSASPFYPYDPKDGRENLETKDHRIVRGGSFLNTATSARCASRSGWPPHFLCSHSGFRVCISSLFPDSMKTQASMKKTIDYWVGKFSNGSVVVYDPFIQPVEDSLYIYLYELPSNKLTRFQRDEARKQVVETAQPEAREYILGIYEKWKTTVGKHIVAVTAGKTLSVLLPHVVYISFPEQYPRETWLVKVAGVIFENRQEIISNLYPREAIRLVRDPNNSHDQYAVKIETLDGEQIGFVPRAYSAQVSALLDSIGGTIIGWVHDLPGGTNNYSTRDVVIGFEAANGPMQHDYPENESNTNGSVKSSVSLGHHGDTKIPAASNDNWEDALFDDDFYDDDGDLDDLARDWGYGSAQHLDDTLP